MKPVRNWLQCIWWTSFEVEEPEKDREILVLIAGRFHYKLVVCNSNCPPEMAVAWCYLNKPELINRLNQE